MTVSCPVACIALTAPIICTFITCFCYRRLPFLRTASSRDRFLTILEQTRQRYHFVVVGYVVMPEHIHLLVTEPQIGYTLPPVLFDGVVYMRGKMLPPVPGARIH